MNYSIDNVIHSLNKIEKKKKSKEISNSKIQKDTSKIEKEKKHFLQTVSPDIEENILKSNHLFNPINEERKLNYEQWKEKWKDYFLQLKLKQPIQQDNRKEQQLNEKMLDYSYWRQTFKWDKFIRTANNHV